MKYLIVLGSFVIDENDAIVKISDINFNLPCCIFYFKDLEDSLSLAKFLLKKADNPILFCPINNCFKFLTNNLSHFSLNHYVLFVQKNNKEIKVALGSLESKSFPSLFLFIRNNFYKILFTNCFLSMKVFLNLFCVYFLPIIYFIFLGFLIYSSKHYRVYPIDLNRKLSLLKQYC